MNMHTVHHQLWATYLPLSYSLVQKRLATKFWDGFLGDLSGRILNSRTMSEGSSKLQLQLKWRKLRPQH